MLSVWTLIGRFVTASLLESAVAVVRDVGAVYLRNDARRAVAVDTLMRRCGLSESQAGLVVELAVLVTKSTEPTTPAAPVSNGH